MSTILDRDQWLEKLVQIAANLGSEGPPIRLCVIGSVACVFGGMAARTTRDLDVWKPASDYDFTQLKQAVEGAGLAFDPKTTLEPGMPYLQLVEPGPTQVGDFSPVLIERFGRLELYRPPIEHLIASKLVRGDARDVDDIVFLAGKHGPDFAVIRGIVDSFKNPGKTQALENLVYLRLVDPDEPSQKDQK